MNGTRLFGLSVKVPVSAAMIHDNIHLQAAVNPAKETHLPILMILKRKKRIILASSQLFPTDHDL